MARITIDELRLMKESEDHVEFKKGEHGNIAYDGGTKCKPATKVEDDWLLGWKINILIKL